MHVTSPSGHLRPTLHRRQCSYITNYHADVNYSDLVVGSTRTQYECHTYFLHTCMALMLNKFKTTNDVTPQITIPRARGMP